MALYQGTALQLAEKCKWWSKKRQGLQEAQIFADHFGIL
jgi:hypothetical protein